jgi:hypothetical protein
MISVWWLFLIVPFSSAFGFFLAALCAMAKEGEQK